MKRFAAVLLGLGLVAGSLISPAAARGKAKPVATTLYMHGNVPVGDAAEWISSIQGTLRVMDPVEPAAGAPSSQSYFFLANEECAGNELYPSWQGKVAGKLAGDVTMKANLVSPGSKVIARIWLDVPYGSCTSSTAGVSDFQPPTAEVVVDVPAGSNEVEIVFEGLKGKAVQYGMVVDLHQSAPGNQGRVLYDSADFPTRIEFSCIPAKGSASCTE